jgi:hypothetical protein
MLMLICLLIFIVVAIYFAWMFRSVTSDPEP